MLLYEELQKALFSGNRDNFDNWIIEFCKDNTTEILDCIKKDILSINAYTKKYKHIKKEYLNYLSRLVKNFNNYLTFFKNFNY